MQIGVSTKSFDALLKTLDNDRDRAAGKYLRLRERLERFFEWRNCENVEELTDIVFDRTIKKIAEGEKILNPEAFCVSISKFVLLENRRETFRTEKLDENSPAAADEPDFVDVLSDKRTKCLDSCLSEIPSGDRALIISYFNTEEKTMISTRKRLAKSIGITLNSLRIRICRLKSKLEVCTKRCCEGA